MKEWSLIFDEAWKLAVENYWDEKKAVSIGSEVYGKYEPLSATVSTRYELSEIIREMQGEFGTSHSYEMGGDLSEIEEYPVGKLGSDLMLINGEYVIGKIFCGDPSNENEKSPLLTGTSTAHEGDVILSIDGAKPDSANPPSSLQPMICT